MLIEIKRKLKQQNSYDFLGYENMKKFAVTIPLVETDDGELAILLEIRSQNLRRQPGEISLPGGRIEATDLTARYAAIRETAEELGINKGDIKIVKKLGVFVPFRHTIIYPFVVNIKKNQFNPNPKEVEAVFLVPLSYLLNTKPEVHQIRPRLEPVESFPFHLIPGGEKYPWGFNNIDEYFYQYQGHVIWGMTAHIIYHFIKLLK